MKYENLYKQKVDKTTIYCKTKCYHKCMPTTQLIALNWINWIHHWYFGTGIASILTPANHRRNIRVMEH